jgi:hypothetical protein
MPRIGRLDIQPTEQANDDGVAAERAAATRAVRQRTQPNLALLQQVLDGLRRM